MFEELGTAIDSLDIPVDGDTLAAVIALRDRLDARISDTVATYDTAGLWELDGATSMTGWLADRAGMARARAAATAARARKLTHLSLTPAAWRDGVLSSGQVDAIAANLDADTIELFAEHETAMMPSLVDLSPRDVTTAMVAWREAASPGPEPRPERPRPCTCPAPWPTAGAPTAPWAPKPGNCSPPPCGSPPPRTTRASPPAARRPGGPTPWVTSAGTSWTTSRPAAVAGTARISTWSSTSSATSPPPAPARRPLMAAGSTGPPSTGCSATAPCTACSPRGGPRSWTTAPPPAPSRHPCSTPSSCETSTAGSPAATGPRTGQKATTSGSGRTAGPPSSRTSSSCAADIITCSTGPAGTPNSSPTPPSRSPTPKAESAPPAHPPDDHHRDYRSNEPLATTSARHRLPSLGLRLMEWRPVSRRSGCLRKPPNRKRCNARCRPRPWHLGRARPATAPLSVGGCHPSTRGSQADSARASAGGGPRPDRRQAGCVHRRPVVRSIHLRDRLRRRSPRTGDADTHGKFSLLPIDIDAGTDSTERTFEFPGAAVLTSRRSGVTIHSV